MPHGHPIGVDIGLEKFLATSDGTLVKPPKFFKQLQSELKLLQRRLSRKQKRSNNYQKARIKVARLHHQIDNTRKDFHFKQSHALCDSAAKPCLRASAGDMVFMEDLDYRTSAQGMLGKHMLDAAFGQFRSIVKYVCWKRGKFCRASTLARFANAEVDARGTSQQCPECGGEVKKDLSLTHPPLKRRGISCYLLFVICYLYSLTNNKQQKTKRRTAIPPLPRRKGLPAAFGEHCLIL